MTDESEAVWRRHVIALLATCAMVFIGAELVARYAVPKISKIESRTTAERAASFHIEPLMNGQRTVLVVGNSLMKTGIDLPLLQKEMQPNWRVQRFIVENTDYYDWYFGLTNLLESGSRPSAIVLMLNTRQFLAGGVRGPNTAYRLFSAMGTLRAGMAAGYHPTEISGMLVGHFSAYYGSHQEIRKVLFEHVVPDALPMIEMMLPERPATDVITSTRIDVEGEPRLVSLRDLCDRFSVKCIFVVPPSMRNSAPQDELVALTAKFGMGGPRFHLGFGANNIAADGTWPLKFFDTDRFHYSTAGAAAYTSLLGQALKDALR